MLVIDCIYTQRQNPRQQHYYISLESTAAREKCLRYDERDVCMMFERAEVRARIADCIGHLLETVI